MEKVKKSIGGKNVAIAILTIRRWLLDLALAIELCLWITELLRDRGFEPCYISVTQVKKWEKKKKIFQILS